MNVKLSISILLIAAGIVVLAYSGITYTTPGETIHFLGLSLATTETHFVPPIVGAFALVGGIVLLLIKPKLT